MFRPDQFVKDGDLSVPVIAARHFGNPKVYLFKVPFVLQLGKDGQPMSYLVPTVGEIVEDTNGNHLMVVPFKHEYLEDLENRGLKVQTYLRAVLETNNKPLPRSIIDRQRLASGMFIKDLTRLKCARQRVDNLLEQLRSEDRKINEAKENMKVHYKNHIKNSEEIYNMGDK